LYWNEPPGGEYLSFGGATIGGPAGIGATTGGATIGGLTAPGGGAADVNGVIGGGV
jgi:hypothetical protein